MPDKDSGGDKQVSRRDSSGNGNGDLREQEYSGPTDTSYTLEPLKDASPQDWLGSNQDPDVLLAVPNLGIDRIKVVVEDLEAHVRLHAKVLDLLELHVGADASIKKVDIEIDNVRVQAMLKVKLDRVVDVVSRVMDTIDAHPEILSNLTAGIGKGVEGALTQGSSNDDGGKDQQSIEGNTSVEYDQDDQLSHDDEDDEETEKPDEREPAGAGSGSGAGGDQRARSRDKRRRRREAQG